MKHIKDTKHVRISIGDNKKPSNIDHLYGIFTFHDGATKYVETLKKTAKLHNVTLEIEPITSKEVSKYGDSWIDDKERHLLVYNEYLPYGGTYINGKLERVTVGNSGVKTIVGIISSNPYCPQSLSGWFKSKQEAVDAFENINLPVLSGSFMRDVDIFKTNIKTKNHCFMLGWKDI